MQPPGAPQAAPKKYDGENGVPKYEPGNGGHYGASQTVSDGGDLIDSATTYLAQQIATAGHAPPPETFTGLWSNVSLRDYQRDFN